MSRLRAGGRLLVAGCSGLQLAPLERHILEAVQPFGMILFARNIDSVEQVRRLVAEIRRAVPGVLLFTDAEGGRVDRLAAAVAAAPAGRALASAPPRTAGRAGRWIGQALRCCDLDADFAPVVDLDHGRESNALDDRYLGASPRAVAARGRAFLAGLRAAGVGGCLKHFPGLGGAGDDTHHRGSRVDRDRSDLDADLAPFAALGAEAGAVMVGHAVYPALDPAERPASLSPPVLGPLLRDELGFAGVAFGDDAEMKALDAWGDLPERCAASVVAGCDAVLVCSRIGELPAVAERLGSQPLAQHRARSCGRLARYRTAILESRRGGRVRRLATVRSRLDDLCRRTAPRRRA